KASAETSFPAMLGPCPWPKDSHSGCGGLLRHLFHVEHMQWPAAQGGGTSKFQTEAGGKLPQRVGVQLVVTNRGQKQFVETGSKWCHPATVPMKEERNAL